MKSEESSPSAAQPVTEPEDVAELVNQLGRSLNTAVLYGTHHPVTVQFLEGCYALLTAFVDHHGGANVCVEEDKLVINGVPAPEGSLAAQLAGRLSSLSLFSFSIEPGFSPHEFVKLMDLLCPHGSGGGAANGVEWIQAAGLVHLQPRAFTYRRVPAEEPPAGAEAQPEPDPAADLEHVVAFLTGEFDAEKQAGEPAVRVAAANPDQLADALLKAVEIRSLASQATESEPLKDIVIGCISKLITRMTSGQSVRTERDRKQARKSLAILAKSLLERLREQAGEGAAQAAGQLIEEARESLDVETTAVKYMRNRKAVEDSERGLRSMIERAGGDTRQLEELRQRLAECGVTPDEWRELTLVRRAVAAEPCGGAAEDIRAIGQLTAQLEDTVARSHAGPAGQSSPELRRLVSDTHRRLASLAKSSEGKIESLRKALKGDSRTPPLSGKLLMETIAEIVQEIIQPLTTATTAIAILSRDSHEGSGETRQEVLDLATESCRRMSHLVNCLFRIAGAPSELYPHRALLSVLYEDPAQTQ